MSLTIGDTAPDFEADTTEGPIKFHEWIGDGWAVLFSHPRDFTPVCTTELGYMASIKPDFDRRNTKIIGLSVDPVDNHEQVGRRTSRRSQGTAPNYPIIADTDFAIAKAYGMLPADVDGRPDRAHARPERDAAQRVRHRAGQEDQARAHLPDDHRPQLRRGPARHRLAAAARRARGRDAGPVAAGRRRDHRRLGLRRGREGEVPRRLEGARPYIRIVPDPVGK